MTCIDKNKTASYLPPLVGLNASSDGLSVSVRWNINAPSYPEQEVVVATREFGIETGFSVHTAVARDIGTIELDNILVPPGFTYTLWIRVETANNYSEWQGMLVENNIDWETGVETVTLLGEVVTFEGEYVTSPL